MIVIIAGLVGFTGWYVWYSNNNASSSYSNAKNTSETASSNYSGSDKSQLAIGKAPVNNVVFSKLPSELQTLALAEIKKRAPACVKDGHLVNEIGQNIDPQERFAPVGAAVINMACEGGAAGYFAKDLKDGSKWVYLTTSQAGLKCKYLSIYPIPKKILDIGDGTYKCLDGSNYLEYDDFIKANYY